MTATPEPPDRRAVAPAPAHGRFLDIDMPERFILECLTSDGSWIDWGRFDADCFVRADDGTYVCSGAPTFYNQLGTLRFDGRRASLRIERTTSGDGTDPTLQTTLQRQLA